VAQDAQRKKNMWRQLVCGTHREDYLDTVYLIINNKVSSKRSLKYKVCLGGANGGLLKILRGKLEHGKPLLFSIRT